MIFKWLILAGLKLLESVFSHFRYKTDHIRKLPPILIEISKSQQIQLNWNIAENSKFMGQKLD